VETSAKASSITTALLIIERASPTTINTRAPPLLFRRRKNTISKLKVRYLETSTGYKYIKVSQSRQQLAAAPRLMFIRTTYIGFRRNKTRRPKPRPHASRITIGSFPKIVPVQKGRSAAA
jgi:hypothetical protein